MATKAQEPYGYLLVHFVEDAQGHAEKIYLSLSQGDDPLRWRRLNHGEPVLESTQGSTGVRDPHVVRRADGTGFHIIATDLRVWADGPQIDWDRLTRHGSRDLVVWDSPDLVHWSPPRYVTVAPTTAGMAWAPEAHFDADSGEYLVYWSSKLYDPEDVDHTGDSYSRIMVARTSDFVTFSPAEVYLDQGPDVIDMTVYVEDPQRPGEGRRVHRFAKDNGTDRGVFQESGSTFGADDFRPVAQQLGSQLAVGVEAPLIFRDNHEPRWYLWVDSYELRPQGYRALVTDDLASGAWELAEGFEIPPDTKHGTVLPLRREEYEAIEAAYGEGDADAAHS